MKIAKGSTKRVHFNEIEFSGGPQASGAGVYLSGRNQISTQLGEGSARSVLV